MIIHADKENIIYNKNYELYDNYVNQTLDEYQKNKLIKNANY